MRPRHPAGFVLAYRRVMRWVARGFGVLSWALVAVGAYRFGLGAGLLLVAVYLSGAAYAYAHDLARSGPM